MPTLFNQFFILLLTLNSGIACRILIIFPLPTPSHQRPQQAISRALADAGHEVVVITPFPLGPLKQPNLHQINASFLFDATLDLSDVATTQNTAWKAVELCLKNINGLTEAVLKHESLQNLLRNSEGNKFDAVIIENLGYAALNQLKYEFTGSALIGITSLELWPLGHEHMGNPNHLLIHPSVFWPSLNLDELNFFERIRHVAIYIQHRYLYWKHLNEQDRILRRYFPDTKHSAEDLANSFDLAIECVSPVLGYVRPILPNTIHIPFLHLEPPKALEKDLEQYLNSSTQGVIYISFGSTIKGVDIGDRLLKLLGTVFSQLKYNVLWKYESVNMPYKPKNAKIMTWTPQVDLLAHKNIKLFIFQGGLQSMEEAFTRGVPMLAIPFFADQDKNAHIVQTLGVGKQLQRHDITETNLLETITEVIDNPKYRKNVEKLRDTAWDLPMAPKTAAVWWIEYAIRNRGSHHLKYKGKDMPFYQYYLLDVIGFVLIFTWLVIYVLIRSYRKVLKNKTEEKIKKMN